VKSWLEIRILGERSRIRQGGGVFKRGGFGVLEDIEGTSIAKFRGERGVWGREKEGPKIGKE